jgi:predicted Zn-dependent protease
MKFQRAILFVSCALLSACADTGPVAPAASGKPGASVSAAMADADAAIVAGRSDKAYAILKRAGSDFPRDKTPWVRMAQMRFDSTDYGQAIVDALAALQRDPDDTLANSIVAVSGLRVTSKALADLSRKNNLTGNVRTEAQELAKLLRANLNEDVLVSGGHSVARKDGAPRRAAPSQAAASAPAPAARAASNDPFGALK